MKRLSIFFFIFGLFLATACNPQKKILQSGNAVIEKVSGSRIQCQDDISTSIAGIEETGTSVFYLVRHAEKQKEGSDPALLPEGTERAKRLATILQDVKLDMICSSPYKRTQATASPTAEMQGIEVSNYSPRPGEQDTYFTNLLNNHPGSKVLVVGHSNTIPKLLNHFKGSDEYNDISEADYNNFFIVTVKDGLAKVNLFKY